MREEIDDRNVEALRPLRSPRTLRRELPRSERTARSVARARGAIRDVLHGRDPRRLVVVVGPCSIHDPELALEYAERLRPLARELEGELVVVMRTYFEKPRTALGWKGFLNDPRLDGSCDVAEGIRRARALLLELGERGLACATELLDPITPQYLADLISWAAIGARTSESQTHREMASGLSMPVGFKNGTDGYLDAAAHALAAARQRHAFLGVDLYGRAAVVHTRGNPDGHLVLRGGRGGPNHGPEHVARAAALGRAQGIARPVMVDCSHGNSERDPRRQAEVCRAVLAQVRAGERALMGLLLESHLEEGSQPFAPGRPLARGVSITDPCIGMAETEPLLREIAAAVRAAAAPPLRTASLARTA